MTEGEDVIKLVELVAGKWWQVTVTILMERTNGYILFQSRLRCHPSEAAAVEEVADLARKSAIPPAYTKLVLEMLGVEP